MSFYTRGREGRAPFAKLGRRPPSRGAIFGGAARFPIQNLFCKKSIFAHEHLQHHNNLKGVRWVYVKRGKTPKAKAKGQSNSLTTSLERVGQRLMANVPPSPRPAQAGRSSLNRRSCLQRPRSRQRSALYERSLVLVLCSGARFADKLSSEGVRRDASHCA